MIILDEPTCGLHIHDIGKLLIELRKLLERGATIVIIEHDPTVIRSADWLVEVGPGSANHGGDLVYQGVAIDRKETKISY